MKNNKREKMVLLLLSSKVEDLILQRPGREETKINEWAMDNSSIILRKN